jgi:hypothetical protein
MEKFTKGKMKATKPLSSNGFWYVDLINNNLPSGSMATLYHSNAENDANLFSVAGEMYSALKLISDLSILSEDKGLSGLVDDLLAKARGESCGK